MGTSWKCADTYLVFVQVEQRHLAVPYHRGCVGLNHIAFHATSRQQVDSLATQLKQRGVTLLYHERYPYAGGKGHYAVYFEDPDKIKVELVAPEFSGRTPNVWHGSADERL